MGRTSKPLSFMAKSVLGCGKLNIATHHGVLKLNHACTQSFSHSQVYLSFKVLQVIAGLAKQAVVAFFWCAFSTSLTPIWLISILRLVVRFIIGFRARLHLPLCRQGGPPSVPEDGSVMPGKASYEPYFVKILIRT